MARAASQPAEAPVQEVEVPEVAETQSLTEAPEVAETPAAAEPADPGRPKRYKK